jgi:hypothetical protein
MLAAAVANLAGAETAFKLALAAAATAADATKTAFAEELKARAAVRQPLLPLPRSPPGAARAGGAGPVSPRTPATLPRSPPCGVRAGAAGPVSPRTPATRGRRC